MSRYIIITLHKNKDKGKILKVARGWCGGKHLIFTGINIRADSQSGKKKNARENTVEQHLQSTERKKKKTLTKNSTLLMKI